MTTQAKQTGKPKERLLVVGNPTVVVGSDRLSLAGELTDEQREKLGEGKVRSLVAAGHLTTQEAVDAAEEARQKASARVPGRDEINPNYGTPSMTPEANAAKGLPVAEPEAGSAGGSGSAGDAGGDPAVALADRPASDLNVSQPVLAALEDAGLNTVGKINEFGKANKGLAGKVNGIGEAREEEVIEAIKKLEAEY